LGANWKTMSKPATAKEIVQSLSERFRPEKAEPGYSATFHLLLSGERGGEFTVRINDGTISVKDGLDGTADCEVKATDETYEDVEWGRTNAQTAFLFGKIKVSDIGAMLDFIGLFHRCPDYYND
jgi:putative sterol carrier protein